MWPFSSVLPSLIYSEIEMVMLTTDWHSESQTGRKINASQGVWKAFSRLLVPYHYRRQNNIGVWPRLWLSKPPVFPERRFVLFRNLVFQPPQPLALHPVVELVQQTVVIHIG